MIVPLSLYCHDNGNIAIWDIRKGQKVVDSGTDHSAGINDMQLSKDGTMFVTASKDTTAKLFDSQSLICLCHAKAGKFDSRFFHLIYEEEFARLNGHFGPINSLAFHPDGKSYASGGEDGFSHDNGNIAIWDIRKGQKVVDSGTDHSAGINDMQLSKDGTMFVTASKDTTAKLFDSQSLICLCHAKAGKFDSRFFHLIYEEEFARLNGHFGPINSLAFHPDGKSYASGGEDGFVRVQSFDSNYFENIFK
ncbi:eukaryotic translation initiation factor 3 subunit I-like [Drosophila teissieri]|uniref:eukaryotic translation initiation factor 3 subunit I-like n=1 Tax=Drosophila teissieri TaxID=7243 RepID=UPI001CB9E378|nr:eukaryotic translation initiation factor 3 subunit I-like [Drosophila teissieri]